MRFCLSFVLVVTMTILVMSFDPWFRNANHQSSTIQVMAAKKKIQNLLMLMALMSGRKKIIFPVPVPIPVDRVRKSPDCTPPTYCPPPPPPPAPLAKPPCPKDYYYPMVYIDSSKSVSPKATEVESEAVKTTSYDDNVQSAIDYGAAPINTGY